MPRDYAAKALGAHRVNNDAAFVCRARFTRNTERVGHLPGEEPPLSAGLRRLVNAAGPEENLVYLYKKTIAAYSPLSRRLSPLLADHEAHLRRAGDAAARKPCRRVAADA